MSVAIAMIGKSWLSYLIFVSQKRVLLGNHVRLILCIQCADTPFRFHFNCVNLDQPTAERIRKSLFYFSLLLRMMMLMFSDKFICPPCETDTDESTLRKLCPFDVDQLSLFSSASARDSGLFRSIVIVNAYKLLVILAILFIEWWQ